MKEILKTQYLNVREFTMDDSIFILTLLNTEGWLKYIGDRGIKTEDDAKKYLLNGPLKSYQTHGFGLWCVELKDEKIPIGMCGLLKRDTLDYPDIGFAFLPEHSGKGYAYEAALATKLYAENVLRLPKLLGITLGNNSSSINLLKKIGLQFEKMIKQGEEDLMLFSCNLK